MLFVVITLPGHCDHFCLVIAADCCRCYLTAALGAPGQFIRWGSVKWFVGDLMASTPVCSRWLLATVTSVPGSGNTMTRLLFTSLPVFSPLCLPCLSTWRLSCLPLCLCLSLWLSFCTYLSDLLLPVCLCLPLCCVCLPWLSLLWAPLSVVLSLSINLACASVGAYSIVLN